MTLNYNPFHDSLSVPQIPEEGVIFGSKTVNTPGLLEELMLRAGLGFPINPSGLRLTKLIEVLRDDDGAHVWSESFKIDPAGVAKSIINWRDTLMMEFNPEDLKGISKRLDDVISVADDILPSSADAWVGLMNAFKDPTSRPFISTDSIIVAVPEALVPRTVKNVLKSCGASVKFAVMPNPIDQEVKIHKCNNLTDAFEWATTEDLSTAIVVNSDNYRLNNVLRGKGKALTASRIESGIPAPVQLMRMALVLLQRPLNVHVLLAYLQNPVSPIPAKVRYSLGRALASDGGFGERWEETIGHIDADDKSVQEWLYPLLEKEWDNDSIPTEVVSDYLDRLGKWAFKQSKEADEEDIPAFFTLKENCTIMKSYLEGLSSIPFSHLTNILSGVCEGTQILRESAQLKCLKTITSPLSMTSTPGKLVWLDCCGDGTTKYPLDFLTVLEIKAISEKIPGVIKSEEYAREYQNCLMRHIGSAKELILISPRFDRGEGLSEHPVVTAKLQDGIKATPLKTPEYDGPVSGFYPATEMSLGRNLLGNFSRRDSQSSIETLIDYPFDYFTDYILGLKDSTELQLQSVRITKGLVAHLFVEDLVADCGKDLRRMESLLTDEFDVRINKAIHQKGLVLLLKENHTDLVSFKSTLKDSVLTLIEILKDNDLKPIECEAGFPEDFTIDDPIGAFNGSVDFITEKANGEIVIIDFKWSESNYYSDKLKNNCSIQLELYRVAVEKKEGRKVAAVGYYLFPKKRLYTCQNLKGSAISLVKTKALGSNLVKVIGNSIEERHEQMKSGILEMAEGKNINSTEYMSVEDKELLKLPVGNKKEKASPFPKGTESTPHQVLKDMLK